MALERLKRKKLGKDIIDKMSDDINHTLIIHYSCESFYNRVNGSSPRVTSLAIRHLGSGQTFSFSIHQIAEREHVNIADIIDKYDILEKQMLDEFFNFASKHDNYFWLHWNMRDINFGFPALEHRAKVLGISDPYHVNESNRIDMARVMVDLFSVRYSKHPRLTTLIETNKITDRDLLGGADEAAAFEAQEYVKLHQSTLRKVDVIANVFYRVADNSIKTNAKYSEIYGGTFPGVINFLQTHWIMVLIGFFSSVAGIVSLFK